MNGDMFGGGTARRSTCSRATRRASATSTWASARCARSAPRRAPRAPGRRRRLRLEDGRIQGHGHQRLRPDADRAARRARVVRRQAARHPAGRVGRRRPPADRQRLQRASRSRSGSSAPTNWDGGPMDEAEQRNLVRRAVIDQLSFDPITGIRERPAGRLRHAARLGHRAGRRRSSSRASRSGAMANVLYEVPLRYTVSGATTFGGDLLRSIVLDVGANFFSKDPWRISFGTGDVTMSYQPAPVRGHADRRRSSSSRWRFGGDIGDRPAAQPERCRSRTRCEPGGGRLRPSRRTACRRSRCSTSGPASGSSSRT